MGVLAPGSAHTRPSAQPHIDVSKKIPAHMSGVGWGGGQNTLNSGHLRLCQQPSAAHALRSDQFYQSQLELMFGFVELEFS
jgi:hypothetical protein